MNRIISVRAYTLCYKEIENLANRLMRPLADDIYAVANELQARAKLAAEVEKRRDAFRRSPSRSGATGSSWPRIEKALNKQIS